MGLPNASISQAGRVEIWTWQNGPDNSLYTYLDVEEVRRRHMTAVPIPSLSPLPKEWRKKSLALGKTGTLVLWTKLTADRMTWKGAKATLKNTAWLVGRIHRRFIRDGKLTIRMVGGEETEALETFDVKINDPLYLTPAPHLPAPYNAVPMFEHVLTEDVPVELNGVTHKVSTVYSRAKVSTLENAGNVNRGDMPYGKDAAENIGVSVIRAGRELMLDRSWTIQYDPRDRWWGCEVEFPPELDEIFGVTNNKQAATVFNELSSLDWQELAEEGEELPDVLKRLQNDGDPKGYLLHLSETIKRNLRSLRDQIKTQARHTRSKGKRHETGDPTDDANRRWKDRNTTNPIADDQGSPSPTDLEAVASDLTSGGDYTADEAKVLVVRIQDEELNVVFVDKVLGGSSELFTVVVRGPITEVVFNTRHPAFDLIFDTVSADEDLNTLSSPELQERLLRAAKALKMLFTAWARMEREDPPNQSRYERVRESWGRLARDFLEPVDLSDLA
jgi:hypothetical protein